MGEELDSSMLVDHGDDQGAEDFARPPIGERTPEVELTEDEKAEVARIAEENGITPGAAELLYRNGDL